MRDYEENMDLYLEQIEDHLRSKRYAALREMFLPMEPADIALILEEVSDEQMPLLYRLLPKELAVEVFVELESDSQEILINGFSNAELKEVLDELYIDDAADIVEEMPASLVWRILDKATPEMRKSINEILKYPEDSAGSIMNVEYLSLKAEMSVADALKRIRRIGGELRPLTFCTLPTPLVIWWGLCPSAICFWPKKMTSSPTLWILTWCGPRPQTTRKTWHRP